MRAKIGHVHLTVTNLDESEEFYTKILGLKVTQRYPGAVFLSFDDYHHHIALNTWRKVEKNKSRDAGLFHFAILYPSRKELAKALKRLIDSNYQIEGASDHGVSEAIYLSDIDGIGLELYVDKPKKDWPYKNGELNMVSLPFDLNDLLKELK
jgi:catechol 2,3-dioxygenase